MQPPTGELTFVFNDVVNSSELWERFGDAMAAARERLYDLLRQHLGKEGYEFADAGDGLYFAFVRADSAVSAAASAVRAISQTDWGEPRLYVRFALHTGTAVSSATGNYYGPTLNRLARLLSAGHGEQILLSDTTTMLVQDTLPPAAGLWIKSLGERHLRNWTRPLAIAQLCGEGLPSEFPPLTTLELPRHNLPLSLNTFVGRENELHEIETLLARNHLVTLKSAGGCGKTRLALEAGLSFLDMYQRGVFFVPLQSLTQPELFWELLAAALLLTVEGEQSAKQTVLAFLGEKKPFVSQEAAVQAGALLILDNCEDLLGSDTRGDFQQILSELLLAPQARTLRILATSREPLGLNSETVYEVAPLGVPPREDDPPEILSGSPAVQLFAARALAADRRFSLEANLSDVVRLVRLLDGIPLALELAARWVGTLSVAEITHEILTDLSILENPDSTAPERHQTMAAAIGWSYSRLARQTEGARTLFLRLAAIGGNFSVNALREYAAFPPLTPARVPLLVRELVEKSLIVRVDLPLLHSENAATEQTTRTEARYRLLEPIRQYAQNQCPAEEREEMRNRHAEWCLTLAETMYPDVRRNKEAALKRLEVELDNLRAALRYWENEPAKRYQLAGAMHRFWYLRGFLNEGLGWLEGVLEMQGLDAEQHARALNGAGILAWEQGRLALAESHYLRCLEIRKGQNHSAGIAAIYNNLGLLNFACKQYALALDYYSQSLALYEETGDQENQAIVLNNLGDTYRQIGDYEQAQHSLEAALRLHEQLDDKFGMAGIAHNLGEMLAEVQQKAAVPNYNAATAWYCQSLGIESEMQHRQGIAQSLEALGEIALQTQNPSRAITLFAAADAIRREIETTVSQSAQERWTKNRDTLRDAFGKQFDDSWQTAGEQSLSEIVMEILAEQQKAAAQ